MEKKIYVLKSDFNCFFSESKEEMIKIWSMLEASNIKRLGSEHDWDDNEIYSWPEELKLTLEVKNVYLYENKDRAMKGKAAIKHAKKVGIIQKKRLKD